MCVLTVALKLVRKDHDGSQNEREDRHQYSAYRLSDPSLERHRSGRSVAKRDVEGEQKGRQEVVEVEPPARGPG